MRRRLRILLLALIAGLAVNFAVVTVCALFSGLEAPDPLFTMAAAGPQEAHIRAWNRFRCQDAPPEPTHVAAERSGLGVTYTKSFHTSDPTGVGDFSTAKTIEFFFFEHVAAGWPFVAMEGGRWENVTTRSGGTVRSAQHRPERSAYSITMFSDVTSSSTSALARPLMRQIPLMPRWTGFVGNTLVYAVPAWLACFTFVRWRSGRRRARGYCAQCGYDLSHAHHSSCPECGALTVGI